MLGERYESNLCGWYTVVEKIPHPKGARWVVEFDEVNGVKYRTTTLKKHVLSGGVKNPYYPLRLGVACVGDVNSKNYVLEFNKWRGMIERCYDPSNNHYNTYGARGVRVCERWLCFEYFLQDLPNLQGYDKDNLAFLHLDKDTVGTRDLYSPENCVLIAPSVNVNEMNKRVKQKKWKATSVKDGHVIYFDNQNEFARTLNRDQAGISKCLSGKQKTFAGYKIEEITEENDNDKDN